LKYVLAISKVRCNHEASGPLLHPLPVLDFAFYLEDLARVIHYGYLGRVLDRLRLQQAALQHRSYRTDDSIFDLGRAVGWSFARVGHASEFIPASTAVILLSVRRTSTESQITESAS
jgi:hypothetical protein